MTNDDKLRGSIKGDGGRRERLAAELRANLRKRKSQARAREAGGPHDNAKVQSSEPAKD